MARILMKARMGRRLTGAELDRLEAWAVSRGVEILIPNYGGCACRRTTEKACTGKMGKNCF